MVNFDIVQNKIKWLGDSLIMSNNNGALLHNSRINLQISGKNSIAICQYIQQQLQNELLPSELLTNLSIKFNKHNSKLLQQQLTQLVSSLIQHRFIASSNFSSNELIRLLNMHGLEPDSALHKLQHAKLTVNGQNDCVNLLSISLNRLGITNIIKNAANTNSHLLIYCELEDHWKIVIGMLGREIIIAAHLELEIIQQLSFNISSKPNLTQLKLAINYVTDWIFKHLNKIPLSNTICRISNIPKAEGYRSYFHRFNPLSLIPQKQKLLKSPNIHFLFLRHDVSNIIDNAIIDHLNAINILITTLTDSLTGPIYSISTNAEQQIPLASYSVEVFDSPSTIKNLTCYGISARECRNQAALFGLEYYFKQKVSGVGFSLAEAIIRAIMHAVLKNHEQFIPACSAIYCVDENHSKLMQYLLQTLRCYGKVITTVSYCRIHNFQYLAIFPEPQCKAFGITIEHAVINLLQNILMQLQNPNHSSLNNVSTLAWTGFNSHQYHNFYTELQQPYRIDYYPLFEHALGNIFAVDLIPHRS